MWPQYYNHPRNRCCWGHTPHSLSLGHQFPSWGFPPQGWLSLPAFLLQDFLLSCGVLFSLEMQESECFLDQWEIRASCLSEAHHAGTFYTRIPQTWMCPGITWGISLKCKFWFRESRVGQDPAFLTCSQWMLRLLARGPHLQKEIFTGFPLKVPQGLEELPIVVPSSIAYPYWFPSFPVSPPLSGFLWSPSK